MLQHGHDQDDKFDKEIVMEEQNIYKNQDSLKNTSTFRSNLAKS